MNTCVRRTLYRELRCLGGQIAGQWRGVESQLAKPSRLPAGLPAIKGMSRICFARL
jgi:hypothetical protein